jgi:hypothetical protein
MFSRYKQFGIRETFRPNMWQNYAASIRAVRNSELWHDVLHSDWSRATKMQATSPQLTSLIKFRLLPPPPQKEKSRLTRSLCCLCASAHFSFKLLISWQILSKLGVSVIQTCQDNPSFLNWIFIFPRAKTASKAKRYQDVLNIERNLNAELNVLHLETFADSFQKLV